jgi:hypothetical protein
MVEVFEVPLSSSEDTEELLGTVLIVMVVVAPRKEEIWLRGLPSSATMQAAVNCKWNGIRLNDSVPLARLT